MQRELASWLCGRWDSRGGYIRFWFDGPGFAWRIHPRRAGEPGYRFKWLCANQ